MRTAKISGQSGFVVRESPHGQSLFYTDDPMGTSLWGSELDGSRPVKMLDGVLERGFVPLKDRICYLHEESSGGATLRSFDLVTGTSTVITSIQKKIFGAAGLPISRDGRYYLYSQVERSGGDLMPVEDFRQVHAKGPEPYYMSPAESTARLARSICGHPDVRLVDLPAWAPAGELLAQTHQDHAPVLLPKLGKWPVSRH